MLDAKHIKHFESIVGKENVYSDKAHLIAYSYDATRTRYEPEAVVFPRDEADVSAILQYCNEHLIVITPRGAGSGFTGGALPTNGGIILGMEKHMNKILEIDTENMVAVVQPGVINMDLQRAVEEMGLMYPPDPASEEYSTLGGNVSENAGGMRAAKYGITKDYVMALRAVRTNGDIIRAGKRTIKDVAGYNTAGILIASEGTLAVLTELTLKLIPKPKFTKGYMGIFPSVDDAMNAGFGWKIGPFETWDALGVAETVKAMEEAGKKPAQWVYDMLAAGKTSFFTVKNGRKFYYDLKTKDYKEVPGQENKLSLALLRGTNIVWENNDVSIFDLGDGVLNVEFHSKMNTIGQGTLEGLNKAVDMAEADYKALVISNEGDNFSAGANVGMIYMLAVEQEWEDLNMAVQWFQKTTMRLRYSSIPVIAAPHGMALGGGCEVCMHSDKVIAHAETYMGLVEFGVGLIPGGGGTKEFALRLGDELRPGDIRTNQFLNRYLSIGQAKVSTSAYEAFDLGYLRPGIDEVIVSRAHQLAYAKKVAIEMADKGYSQPAPRNDIKVLGREALGMVYVGSDGFKTGHYMSEHDGIIAEKLGYVMAGGEISQALTEVSEQYLLDLERKAFMELCMQRKTLERINSLITKGKILRN